jgi:Glyoxalase-like domain
MTEHQWAELRQVGLATLGHAAAVRAATELLELGSGFDDPLLADWHLTDFTAPIGPDTYLEILAPTTPDHSMTRWLGRAGGAAGWVLATQVPSLDGVQERAAERGVRIAVQTRAMGHNIVQFHPLDVGVLLELDEFLPRTAWFWDDMETARAAQASRSTKVDNIVAVDVAVQDPAAMAATWAALIGIEPPASTPDGAALAFSSRTIRFVPAAGGRTGIVVVDMHVTDRDHGPGLKGELCNTLIRFV